MKVRTAVSSVYSDMVHQKINTCKCKAAEGREGRRRDRERQWRREGSREKKLKVAKC